MRFADRISAGAALIRPIHDAIAMSNDPVVLALPRGGVVVAAPVADALHLPLDVLVVRKLGVPQQPEVAMGAMVRGEVLLDREVIELVGLGPAAIHHVIDRERKELERRERVYRHGVPAVSVANRTAIVIDDGIATGSTVLSAVRAVRALNPSRIILATPVASEEALDRLRPEVDQVICLFTPRPFHGVGTTYRNFSQVSDAEVIRLLQQSRQRSLARHV